MNHMRLVFLFSIVVSYYKEDTATFTECLYCPSWTEIGGRFMTVWNHSCESGRLCRFYWAVWFVNTLYSSYLQWTCEAVGCFDVFSSLWSRERLSVQQKASALCFCPVVSLSTQTFEVKLVVLTSCMFNIPGTFLLLLCFYHELQQKESEACEPAVRHRHTARWEMWLCVSVERERTARLKDVSQNFHTCLSAGWKIHDVAHQHFTLTFISFPGEFHWSLIIVGTCSTINWTLESPPFCVKRLISPPGPCVAAYTVHKHYTKTYTQHTLKTQSQQSEAVTYKV